jgi:hypothetical protein
VQVLLSLIVGLYLGLGGLEAMSLLSQASSVTTTGGGESFEFDGIPFSDLNSVWTYVRMQRVSAFFPWIQVLPESALPIVLCGGFGIAGGALCSLWALLRPLKLQGLRRVSTYPLVGGLAGLLLGVTALILPGETLALRNHLLGALSFFGGLLSGQASARIARNWPSVFG